MLKSMTARELFLWQAYYELEPSLDQRIDWLIASVREMIHNSPREQKHHRPIKDFLLTFETEAEKAPSKQTWQMQKAMMLMYLNEQPATPSARQTESGER